MRSKKLLILILVLVIVLVVAIVLSAVFSVAFVTPVYHREDGTEIAASIDAPSINDVADYCKGQSIFFLNKQNVLDKINENNTSWHAVAIVKNFPNRIDIHFVKRIAVMKLYVNMTPVYVDSFGYVMDTVTDKNVIDVTSNFTSNLLQLDVSGGTKLVLDNDNDNTKLQCILSALSSAWQVRYSYQDVPQLITSFDFDNLDNMTLTTSMGAKIIVKQPQNNLSERLIDAFSIYFSKAELQKAGVEIRCEANGGIVTPK